MRIADMYLNGIGSVVPPVFPVERAVADGLYPALEAEVHEYLGVAVAGERPAPDMALEAAKTALKRADREPTELALLLYTNTWHQGPEGWPPQAYLQRHLVGGRVPAMAVRQGCNGMFDALELAACYLRAEPDRESALLVAADNYGTPLIDRWRVAPGMIAGDAAVAVVVTKNPGFARLLSVSSIGAPAGEELHRSGEPMFPPTVTEGRPQDFTARFEHYRANPPDGAGVLTQIPGLMLELVETAVSEAGIEIKDLARVAFETHSRDIVEQRLMVPLGLDMAKSTWEFGRRIGHCGAADQFLAFEHLLAAGELAPGDHLLLVGQAPGVVLSAAVVQVLDIPNWTT
ncbi:ketoacyl-ACP synthase III family protein [Saccharopolyspora phatthalungensis]|uniref:3-oxoacyl-[acyl-carrier-protein] synthase III n=1 Tax=Saccharopolyspora phatthalungensis TaxID=664693 RepID=A0A840QI05_9PSEU|nr:ketoacyl-ACP synthase III family protein [Saccharopolyspora phatthalungensis]MBB5156953.1 3-oxoacyl-[acyl-carrier-protein] synthase III [Saccharopolyspora phatthalungensis]